jgi:hypothetical protein
MLRQLDADPLRAADVAAALSWAIGAGGTALSVLPAIGYPNVKQ